MITAIKRNNTAMAMATTITTTRRQKIQSKQMNQITKNSSREPGISLQPAATSLGSFQCKKESNNQEEKLRNNGTQLKQPQQRPTAKNE
jgi:hypothetical protein